MKNKIILKDCFQKSRSVALGLIGIMILTLYGLAIIKPKTTIILVKSADQLPPKFNKRHSSLTSSLNPLKIFENLKSYNISVVKVAAINFDDLQSIFSTCDYNVSAIRSGNTFVPRLYLMHLPKDIAENIDIEARKNTFILALLPMILKVNEKILQTRQKLLKLASQSTLSRGDKVWLKELFRYYGLKNEDMDELKIRVDIIPPSLFLAQAIIETGWGTSNAALAKKSLFGVTLKQGVKEYATLEESIEAYIHNLNYNAAYREMRALRHEMRLKNSMLCSHQLIGKLLKYCEKRVWYINKVRRTIYHNNLKQFDDSILENHNA